MIVESVAMIEAGRWRSPYRYLIVDEFQDISLDRAKLLQALLGQIPDAKLFCVGDDWQSIFRFAGSDIDLMTNFGAHLGHFRRTDLRQTHRFGSNSLAASSKFVMSNPQQLPKALVPAYADDGPSVEVHSGAQTHDEPFDLSCVLDRIRLDAASWKAPSSGNIEVLLLGRNKFVNDRYLAYQRFPGFNVQITTVHKAKGSEADYAIILDVVGGRLGFPSEIVDDPVLDVVLAGQYPFPHAEERRLFYVALTRARRKTYIVTHDSRRSVFVDEIESGAYAGLVIASGSAQAAPPCPRCGGGRLEKRKGDFGEFFGCSNYPMCRGTSNTCHDCRIGAFVRRGSEYVCHNPACGNRLDCCPKCRMGYLSIKRGRYGEFWGCSEYREDETRGSCNYTRKVRHGGN